MVIDIPSSPMYGLPKSKKCGRFVLFMPFLLVVRVEYHTICNGFVTC